MCTKAINYLITEAKPVTKAKQMCTICGKHITNMKSHCDIYHNVNQNKNPQLTEDVTATNEAITAENNNETGSSTKLPVSDKFDKILAFYRNHLTTNKGYKKDT